MILPPKLSQIFSSAPSSSGKIQHLQGIRGIAILSIICFHFMPLKFPNGYFGVDLFFVLSGYLMSKIMSKCDEISWSSLFGFWFRRGKRILPLYYLIMFVTIFSLYFFSLPNLSWLIDSATNALLLRTNTISYSGMDYFIKSSAFCDLFTHTWSLCAEMQFYLIFPLVWFSNMLLPGKYAKYHAPWFIFGGASICFYFIADDFTSFNSVFSRIWQFSVGVLVYIAGEKEKIGKDDRAWIASFMGLIILAFTMFGNFSISGCHMRIIITACSALPIAFGNGCCLLENPLIVFLGEISYSWYLVHWPIVTLQRQYAFFEIYYFILFITASFLLAIFFHYAFEQFYLKWENNVIVILTSVLLFSSALILQPLIGMTPREIAKLHQLTGNYSNLSKEEVIQFNKELHYNDVSLLTEVECLTKEYTAFSKDWQGFCELPANISPFTKKNVMLIGNSWAANVARVFHEECRPYFNNLTLYTVGGCDVLPNVIRSCKVEAKYTEYVERARPDVLFIAVRTIDLLHVDDGMLPLEDSVFNAAKARLLHLESLVSKKIYLLDVFPLLSMKITETVNSHIRSGENLETKDLLDNQNGFKVAKMRMKELATICRKCELYDYVPSFQKPDRSLGLYDDKSFVTYFNSVLHLTLPGLEKVRPLYKELCRNVADL